MNILIGIYFNSPHGGLHDNVFSSAKAVLDFGGNVTILCKPGEFADRVAKIGCTVVETNFSLLSFSRTYDLLMELHTNEPFDVIHTHPFSSREILLYFAKRNNIPLVLTMHGQYSDELEIHHRDFELIFTVSEGIKAFLSESISDIDVDKIHVLRNSVDKVYDNKHKSRLTKESDAPLVVTCVTRFDPDKQFILDVFIEAVAWSLSSDRRICWDFIGDGSLLLEFKNSISSLLPEKNSSFSGWLSDKALANKYRNSDVVIAPGRCAIDALASGVPVIAVGSKGYIGLIDQNSWKNGVFSNFGGIGSKFNDYERGFIGKDLHRLFNENIESNLRKLGPLLASTFFSIDAINSKLLNFYSLASLKKNSVEGKIELKSLSHPKYGLSMIHIESIGNSEILVRISHEYAIDYTFAWYEYLDGEVIQKHGYSESSEKLFTFTNVGVYSIRCFIKGGDSSKISFIVADFEKNRYEQGIKVLLKNDDANVHLKRSDTKGKVTERLNFNFELANAESYSKLSGLSFER